MKRCRVPRAIPVGRNVLDPLAQGFQRLLAQGTQLGIGGLGLGQPGVHHLFQRPGGVSKRRQPHHARAALEGVERAPQRGHVGQAAGGFCQRRQCGLSGLGDVAGLFQEDVQQVVFNQGRPGIGRGGFGCGGLGHGHQVGQRLGAGLHTFGGHHSGGFARGGCHGGVVRQRGVVGQVAQALGEAGDVERGGAFVQHVADHVVHRLGELLAGRRLRGHRCGGRCGPAHQGLQLAQGAVEHKQLARQHRLVVQHVDQEAERAEVVGQVAERARLLGTGHVDLVGQHAFHVGAHVRHGLRGVVQAQHRQHPAHLGELLRHAHKVVFVCRIARELVQGTLQLAQTDLEFTHHTAHGVAVADAAVQVFHPGFQRQRGKARVGGLHALGHVLHAAAQVRVVRVHVLHDRFEVEHSRGHLQPQFGAGQGTGGVDGLHQRSAQRRGLGQDFFERFVDQPKLVHHLAGFGGVTTGQKRPALFRRVGAFARLGQQRGVVAAQRGVVVVHRNGGVKPVRLSHRVQPRGGHGSRHPGLSCEKQQVVLQHRRHVAAPLGLGGVLQQHARGRPFDVHIAGQQRVLHGLKVRRGRTPEHALGVCHAAGGQTSGHLLEVTGRHRVLAFHDVQHVAVELRPHIRPGHQR